eukprot:gene50737-biopygen35723
MRSHIEMTIAITLSNAAGIDFSAYLADYQANFVKSGYGAFSGDNYTGAEYSFTDGQEAGQGVVLGASQT